MPSQHEQPRTLAPQQARQGKEFGTMRHVLWVSIALAVIAGVAIYFAILG